MVWCLLIYFFVSFIALYCWIKMSFIPSLNWFSVIVWSFFDQKNPQWAVASLLCLSPHHAPSAYPASGTSQDFFWSSNSVSATFTGFCLALSVLSNPALYLYPISISLLSIYPFQLLNLDPPFHFLKFSIMITRKCGAGGIQFIFSVCFFSLNGASAVIWILFRA